LISKFRRKNKSQADGISKILKETLKTLNPEGRIRQSKITLTSIAESAKKINKKNNLYGSSFLS
jgi:hypothetical protein